MLKKLKPLLKIPVCLLIDVIGLIVVSIVQSSIDVDDINQQGHPVLNLTIIVMLILCFLTAIISVISIVQTFINVIRDDERPVEKKEKTDNGKWYGKVLAVLIIADIATLVCSIPMDLLTGEQPEIGFRFPTITIMAMIFGGAVNIVILLIIFVAWLIDRNRK